MKKSSLNLMFYILSISFVGCIEDKNEAETGNSRTEELNVEAADFEILKVEDQSHKALGKKLLSQYETSELEQLPTDKKILYRIALSKDVKENQVKPTVEKIIDKLTSDDSDIDEIILWLYSSKEVIKNPYDIGTAIWAPYGKLGNINAKIAKSNNRDNYKIEYEITKNLDEYLTQMLKSETKFGFTENERKQIFKEIISAENKGSEYERIEQHKMLDKILEKYGKLDDNSREKLNKENDKISGKANKIMTEEKSKVYKKYKITEEQDKEIRTEAITENWLFD